MSIDVKMIVNGKPVRRTVEPGTLLVHFIRNELGLTGTHVGCDTAQCGACSVSVDGRVIKSCSILAAQVQDCSVLTIEGVAGGEELHLLQTAFLQCHGLQCGYCTPGMIMTALDIIGENSNPSREEIAEGLDGNLCRCTGYHNIVDAIELGARMVRQGGGSV